MALITSLTMPATPALVDGAVVELPETTYPASYARVLFVRSFANESYVCVCWYADEAARFAGADPVKVYEYPVSTEALKGDVYPAAYAYLKGLPEFAGAVDHMLVDAPTEEVVTLSSSGIPAPEVVAPAVTEPSVEVTEELPPYPTQPPAEA
jgi:hypothetical protein